tara:strand:- start:73 stop:1011 length:939 start_codon:yes stop_codon:yes gene_type:complete
MQFARQEWFYKRFIRKSKTIKLGLRNLYIFPNIFGFYWLISIIFLYVLGINLEAAFTIFISYLMSAIFFISLFLTHFNLHGLELSSPKESIHFANSIINYDILLKSKKNRSNLKLKFLNKYNQYKIIENIYGNRKISLTTGGKKRGIYYPDTIYGESSSPLSLFNCWFYWNPLKRVIVAPEIKKGQVDLQYTASNLDNKISASLDFAIDEVKDLKDYKKGEKKSLIYWKLFAKSKTLQTKIYQNESNKFKWLRLNHSLPLERALENLCFEVHNEFIRNNIYAIKLNEKIFNSPGKGINHYKKTLYLLAKFEK